MPNQTTPHTNTQQNVNPGKLDANPDEFSQETAQGDDDAIYNNMDGAQTAGSRAAHIIDADGGNKRNVEQPLSALTGSQNSRLPQNGAEGITTRPEEEAARQQKVVSDRPDAQAGVDQEGHKAA